MNLQTYASRASASAAAADHISRCLRQRLSEQSRASLMLSGGSTPIECLHMLSGCELDWSQVDVTLSDEREVAPTHADSNANMVRQNLMTANAAQANLVPLTDDHITPLLPFACALIGMGEDGHFASLFPDSPQLQQGLTDSVPTLKVTTPSSPYDRTSATLATICQSELIILLAFGEKKRQLLSTPNAYPVGHLLSQKLTPVHIIWAA